MFNPFNPKEVLAGGVDPITNPIADYGDAEGYEFFSRLVPALISALILVGAIVFLFSFIVGAIQYVNAGGDKGLVESARNKILNSLIGLVILFSVFAILGALEIFFGIDLFVLDLTTLQI